MKDGRLKARGGLDAIEARNALAAEGFRTLPEGIALWRFREVLMKLGTELALSAGAVLYALDLIGLLTEADWRGDGRAVTFHSVRSYARKVGKSERTICEYERQLIAAGLIHRTLKHARRHGGQGCEARRTGLDWRAFGAAMPSLLARLDEREADTRHRLDIEARIRESRTIVAGLIEGMDEAPALRTEFAAIGIGRLRGTIPMADLENRFAALLAFRARVTAKMDEQAVEKVVPFPQPTEKSEERSGQIYSTETLHSPKEICSEEPEESRPIRYDSPIPESRDRAHSKDTAWKGNAIALDDIWEAAPASWKTMLGRGEPITWPILIDLANHMAPRLGVGANAWGKALHRFGQDGAALALMVLDRNRNRPKDPVINIGGALVGMMRRQDEGTLDLLSSIHGIIARRDSPHDPPEIAGARWRM